MKLIFFLLFSCLTFAQGAEVRFQRDGDTTNIINKGLTTPAEIVAGRKNIDSLFLNSARFKDNVSLDSTLILNNGVKLSANGTKFYPTDSAGVKSLIKDSLDATIRTSYSTTTATKAIIGDSLNEYTRYNLDEVISGNWNFTGTVDFSSVIFADTGYALADNTVTPAKITNQLMTVSDVSDAPDYTGRIGIKNDKLLISTSTSNQDKWMQIKDDMYPFKITSEGLASTLALDSIANFIVDLKLIGTRDTSKGYSVSRIARNYSTGAWQVYISSHAKTSSSGFTTVALFNTTSSPEKYDSVTVHYLTESGGSGISGYIAVNWSKLESGKLYENLFSYSNDFILRDEVWSEPNAYIINSQTALDSSVTHSTRLTNLESTKLDIPSDGLLYGVALSDTQYIHPNGLSDYGGNSSYGQPGVGFAQSLPNAVFFDKVMIKAYASNDAAIEARVYMKSTIWSGSSLSDLTLVETVTYGAGVFNITSGDWQTITLTSKHFIPSGYYVYVLLGKMSGTSLTMSRWTTDTTPARLYLRFNTNSSPFTTAWSTGSGTYYSPPILLLQSGGVSTSTAEDVRLILPDTLYCSASDTTEYNLYFDNVVFVPNYKNYFFEIVCDSGSTFTRGWRYTPADGNAGTFPLSVIVRDINYDIIDQATTTVKVADNNMTSALTYLMIGNSLTANNTTALEIKSLSDNLTFIGTQDLGTAPTEGYSGKTWVWFESDTASPFVHSVGGNVDLQTYLTNNSFPTPDICTIELGINDISDGDVTLGVLDASITSFFDDADSLINNFLSVNPAMQIGIVYNIPPSYYQDAIANQGSHNGSKYYYRYKLHRYWEMLKSKYGAGGTGYNAQVTLIPLNLGIDTENNMLTTTVTTNRRNPATITQQSNELHPAAMGYKQMADFYYGWIVNRE